MNYDDQDDDLLEDTDNETDSYARLGVVGLSLIHI